MIDIGKIEVEVECPNCDFYNPVYLRQAKIKDVIICRGCKSNIQLKDHFHQVRKAERTLRKSFDELSSSLDNFGN